MTILNAISYRGYADLVRHQQEGIDYQITVLPRPESRIAIIAPHGGAIERGTSQVARLIARDNFNLYLFEGIKPAKNYESLHLTSHLFDEPECLALISNIAIVVAIHGCNGKEEKVYLGGLDNNTKIKLATALEAAEINVYTEGHDYPAINPTNICNRGLTKKGVQIELTDPLRGSVVEAKAVNTIRKVLVSLDRTT